MFGQSQSMRQNFQQTSIKITGNVRDLRAKCECNKIRKKTRAYPEQM